ncbi:hypothetical protein [Streptomyces axinellae]|uniref:hypothetical protein n=1 Tax=Streptomyces axinellae TaxID=552788 RepID=UPI003CD0B5E0
MASALCCDVSLISRIENGKRVCSQQHFAQPMDLYEFPADPRDEIAGLHTAARERSQPVVGPVRRSDQRAVRTLPGIRGGGLKCP